MMSEKLRRALTVFSMILIAGGTPLAILMLALTWMLEQAVTAPTSGLRYASSSSPFWVADCCAPCSASTPGWRRGDERSQRPGRAA
ncbi:hypothetical protein [Brevundimonas abyssalis]|uniref:hypothetical protein n=1 Tax=Brevundimonas abyssalis TaxID=1125965 RepID=UPI0005EBF7DC|nr:hypothetical protein [Brevundimonas abyssalis]